MHVVVHRDAVVPTGATRTGSPDPASSWSLSAPAVAASGSTAWPRCRWSPASVRRVRPDRDAVLEAGRRSGRAAGALGIVATPRTPRRRRPNMHTSRPPLCPKTARHYGQVGLTVTDTAR